MKKTYLIICLFLAFVGCQKTNQRKTKVLDEMILEVAITNAQFGFGAASSGWTEEEVIANVRELYER